MKPLSNFNLRYILIRYVIFVILISLLFYFLAPAVTGLSRSNFLKKEVLIQATWFIISTGVFLFIATYFFNKKINEEKLAANETIHRFEALSSATNDSIWDYDIKTEKIFYNERLLNTFGYNREELSDNTNWWENNIHEDDKMRVIQRMNATLGSDKSNWEDEYRFKCKNGEYKIVYDRSFIVRDALGKPLRLIGAMKDVTKLRSLEKQAIIKQLQSKNEMGKTIISSHELERKRIKDILQEDVNQVLASIKFFMIELKEQHPSATITKSLDHLEEAMKKIMAVSKKLSSSTFEFFGLAEGIHELINDFGNISSVQIELDETSFSEEDTNPEVRLLLFRILEDKLSLITGSLKTDKIHLVLSNQSSVANLSIAFQCFDPDINELLNQTKLIDIKSKLEMYGGTMQIKNLPGNNYKIEVIV